MLPSASSDSHATRETLFLRLKADAPAREVAWREFHDRYAPIIGGFARRMGAREQDVTDVVQDVLVGFFAASPRFVYDPSKGRFRGYLKTCTWRVLRDRLGESVRFQGRGLTEIDPAEYDVEQAWNDVWEGEKLHRAVEIVRERYSTQPDRSKTFQAFEMYVLLERPSEEIAAELGLTVDSVHQAKTRISKAIKAAMEEIGD